jgi:hypothetical protein
MKSTLMAEPAVDVCRKVREAFCMKAFLPAAFVFPRSGSPCSGAHPSTPAALLWPTLLSVLFLSASPLQARLGESPIRVEARYGAPMKVENGVCARDFECTYRHGGMTIVVHYLDEKSQYESYSNESGDSIAADEIQRLLEINRRGGKWKLKDDTSSGKKWELNSGEATAVYEPQPGRALEIKTVWWQHFAEQHPTEKVTNAIERLKDF